MKTILAFDVYGTLIDTHGLVGRLEALVGEQAIGLSQTWRDKQLEYSFRRGLMQNYLPFSECTRSALEYACKFHRIELSDNQKSELMIMYAKLPAFPDAFEGLSSLDTSLIKPFAFSNGTEASVRKLLQHAELDPFISDVVSVDDLKTFKPNPKTYQYFMERSDGAKENTWLISSNPFDVIGAITFGMKAVWVKRSESALFDDWEVEPDLTTESLSSIGSQITEQERLQKSGQ